MAVDNNNNLPIETDGTQAIIGTDVYVSGGETAHAQVMKIAWGDSLTVERVTTSKPLPVSIHGLTGDLATITVTGSVSGIGNFNVTNTSANPVHVTGGIIANVYGVTGAPAVTVTGGVSIISDVGITGFVNVTGGRFLNSSTDSIQVTGSVGRSWMLNNVDDGVRIWSHAGGTFIPTKLYSSSGNAIGASGDALNVNIIGAGISANVDISASVGVYNDGNTILRVQGTANGTPIPVSLSSLPIVSINDNGANSTTNPLFVDIKPTDYTINNLANQLIAENNFAKMLIAQNPRLGTQSSIIHSAAQWLSYIWDSMGEKGSSEAGTLHDKINKIVTRLNQGKSSVDFIVDPFVFAISMTNPGNSSFTINNIKNQVNIDLITKANGFLYTNKTNAPVYLVSQFYLEKIGINDTCSYVGTSPPCPQGVSVSVTETVTPDYIITANSAIATQIKNGSYEVPANESVLLPALYTKVFMLTTPTTGNILTITAV